MKKMLFACLALATLMVSPLAITQVFRSNVLTYRGAHDTISIGNSTIAIYPALHSDTMITEYARGLVIFDPAMPYSALIQAFMDQEEVYKVRIWGGGNFWVYVPCDCLLVTLPAGGVDDTTQVFGDYR